jgi:hypothetical protein
MPGHAIARWLTDQVSSATIRTTPKDRLLAIAGTIVKGMSEDCCDWRHFENKFT